MRPILVVGSTGILGRPVVRKLRERGLPVRALNRHPEDARDLANLGAEVVRGDLTDPESLVRACQGASRVLACAHSLLGRGRWSSKNVDDLGHRALISAAQAAKVERFVYTSASSASPSHPIDFFRTKFAIERAVLESGLDAVVLRPSAYMEFHVHRILGTRVLAGRTVPLFGAGNYARNFIAAEDVANVAVQALLEERPRRQIELYGPSELTELEIISLYSQGSGRPAKTSHVPLGVAKALSVLVAPFHPGVARLMKLVSNPGDLRSPRPAEAPSPLMTVEQFVDRQLKTP